MDVFWCIFFLLSSPLRLRFVSVFDFNDSLNDIAPASPILFAGNVKRNEKKLLADGCLLDVFLLSLQLRSRFGECCV